jgi:hypothetical protein
MYQFLTKSLLRQNGVTGSIVQRRKHTWGIRNSNQAGTVSKPQTMLPTSQDQEKEGSFTCSPKHQKICWLTSNYLPKKTGLLPTTGP